jgi:hypothetical protein
MQYEEGIEACAIVGDSGARLVSFILIHFYIKNKN